MAKDAFNERKNIDSLPCSVNHELNMTKVNINYATEKLRNVDLDHQQDRRLNGMIEKSNAMIKTPERDIQY